MSLVYLFCLSLGFLFTVGGAVFGHLVGGGDHDAGGHDAGGHDLHVGGDGPELAHSYDAGGAHAGFGEGDVGSGHADGIDLPVLSPTVISFFLFMFGGTGLLYERVCGIANPWIHTPLAAGSALVAGLALAYVLYKITSTFESNRVARLGDALAAPAEVTISVPKDGMGEIAYLSAGTRQTLSARSADGHEHKQSSQVRVLKVADGVAWVGEAPLKPASLGAVSSVEPARGEPVLRRERS